MIPALFLGIRFFIYFLKIKISKSVLIEEKKIKIQSKIVKFKIYTPKKIRSKQTCIYFQHGLNPNGISDDRVIHLAITLANIGYFVITPELKDVKELKIHSKTIPIIGKLAIQFEKLTQKKISYLSVSLSAGLGVLAFANSRKILQPHSMFLIGSYQKLEDSFLYMARNFTVDPYAFYLVLYNYILYFDKKLKNLKKLFYYLALADVMGIEKYENKINRYKTKMSKLERFLFQEIIQKEKIRIKIIKKIIKKFPENLDNLNPINHINEIRTRFYLLHGKNDPIIPSIESIHLFEQLQNQQLNTSKILISTLISHGDAKIGLKDLFNILEMIIFWGNYLKNL